MDGKWKCSIGYGGLIEATGAAELTKRAGGSWYRDYGLAPCPICQPERRRDQRALSIGHDSDRLLLHCHKSGCSFREILGALDQLQSQHSPVGRLAEHQKAPVSKPTKSRCAQILWQQADPIVGTPGDAYFRARGITCALPQSLRYLPDVRHAPSGNFVAAIVAKVDPTGGVHRTFLAKTGERLRDDAKMMLGPCRGGAVRLAETDGPLIVCEGLETGLSLMSGTFDRDHTVWAALSTSGMMALDLPATPRNLIVATDGDKPGRNAGTVLARRAAALGWQVGLLPAPDGADWNDVLRAGGLS